MAGLKWRPATVLLRRELAANSGVPWMIGPVAFAGGALAAETLPIAEIGHKVSSSQTPVMPFMSTKRADPMKLLAVGWKRSNAVHRGVVCIGSASLASAGGKGVLAAAVILRSRVMTLMLLFVFDPHSEAAHAANRVDVPSREGTAQPLNGLFSEIDNGGGGHVA